MAKVATRGPTLPSSNPLHFSGTGSGVGGGTRGGVSSKVTTAIKRKTPSELRSEQLKRKSIVELIDESVVPEIGSLRTTYGVTCEPKKPDLPKIPRYIDTRVDELFPSRKNGLRLRMLSGKENVKENIAAEHTESLSSKNSSSSLKFVAQRQPRCPGPNDSPASTTSTRAGRTGQPHSTTEKSSESTFRTVTDLSLGGEKLSGFSLDMDKAFKELAAHAPLVFSAQPGVSSDGDTTPLSAHFCSEFHIPDQKTPLDFTLKTSVRVVSSSSVNWFHRLMSCGPFNDIKQFNSQAGRAEDQKMTCSSRYSSASQSSSSETLHHWVYPQCSLPPSVISALSLSAKGEEQKDFLSKRLSAWEDSFRSLYYMLRKRTCNLFYVCTGQFVAMFTGGCGSVNNRGQCNAYISQSTRILRSLLKEQDISFTMPLCQSKVEQVTTEDLFELSEIEKYNVGKTKRTVSLSDVDNSPDSLLAFSGNKNVHGLYEFLLNYRFLLPSLTSVDVPLLYSPVPFENAALSAPEVKCKEVRKVDHMAALLKDPCTTSEPNQGSASTSYYTIEIKDSYLPPWIISRVCNALESDGGSFEASFVTEPMSVGLNIGLDVVSQNSDLEATANKGLQEKTLSFGITNTVVSPHLSRAFVKCLKYSDNSYTASLSPV